MGSSALNLLFGRFRSGCFAWESSFEHFRSITFVLDPSFVNCRFGTSTLELALRSVRLEPLAWVIAFWGTFARELSHSKIVWELSLGICCPRISTCGNWVLEAGGTVGPAVGETVGAGLVCLVFKKLNNNLSR